MTPGLVELIGHLIDFNMYTQYLQSRFAGYDHPPIVLPVKLAVTTCLSHSSPQLHVERLLSDCCG